MSNYVNRNFTMRLIYFLIFIFPLSVHAVEYDAVYDAYINGDYETAFVGFSELADKDYMRAQFYLGELYREGKGVEQDYAKSLEWYKKAA